VRLLFLFALNIFILGINFSHVLKGEVRLVLKDFGAEKIGRDRLSSLYFNKNNVSYFEVNLLFTEVKTVYKYALSPTFHVFFNLHGWGP
jgi:hypothetical protein